MKMIVFRGMGRFLIAGVFAAVFLTLLYAVPVFAEPWDSTCRFRIFVDGEPFEVRGRSGVRLPDAAYILNGTTAQFDIAEPPDGWDFWIRRGEAYTADDAVQHWVFPIGERFDTGDFSDGLHPRPYETWWWSPDRNIVLGLDGDDEPAITMTFSVAYSDGGEIFFSLRSLGLWLGFTLESEMWMDDPFYWRGADFMITTAHTQNVPTPGRFILRDTFPIGTRQTIAYTNALRVRTGPGNDYDILTFVHRGDEFEILDYHGRFAQIYTDSSAGWIFAGFLCRDRRG